MENKEYLEAVSKNNQALIDITASSEAWISFLRVAGNNFGLPLEAQLAIWQKDKTAVAAMSKEKWIKFGYETNLNNEISVLNGSNAVSYYLIDDVFPTEKSKEIPLWYVDSRDYSRIIDVFNDKYHLSSNGNFVEMITDLSNKMGAESDTKYKELFSNSIKDTILQRCGLDPVCEYTFNNISLSNLLSILNRLNLINREIIGTLRKFSLENGKSVIYTFDNEKTNSYNQSVINIEGEDKNGRYNEAYSNSERRGRNGSRIDNSDHSGRTSVLRESGQVPNSVAGVPEENRETSERDRKIRKNEMGLPQREQSANADRTASSRAEKRNSFGGLSVRTGRDVLGKSSSAFFRYNEERRNNGTSGCGLVEICSGKIQCRSKSKGNSRKRNDLQLTFFNTNNETAGLDENNPAVFVYNNFEKQLLQGTGVVNGKFQVYNHFLNTSDKGTNPSFLKKEYETYGSTFFLTDESRGFFDSSSKGMSIRDAENNVVYLSWNDAAMIIDLLIKADLYLTDPEKEKYKLYIENENNKQIRSQYISKVVGLMDYETAASKSIKDYYRAVRVNQTEFINGENHVNYASGLDEKNLDEIIYKFLYLVSKSNMDIHSQAEELLREFKDFAPNCFGNSIINEYFNLMKQYPDKLLFIQNGSFYEAMGNSAETVAKILNIELTARTDANNNKISVAGIPDNKLDEYVDRIISNNKDVVIATLNDVNSVESIYSIVPGERTVAISDTVEVQTPEEILIEKEQQSEPMKPQIINIDYFAKAISMKTRANTNTHRNFLSLIDIAPALLNEKISYIRLSAGEGFMPLTIEKIGNNQISVSHHYVQNGDLMSDPEIVYYVDEEKQELRPREYRQDNLGLYQTVEDDNGSINMVAEAELSKFTVGWFDNIKAQGYITERMFYEYQNEDMALYFNSNKQFCRIDSELAEQFCKEHNIVLADNQPNEVLDVHISDNITDDAMNVPNLPGEEILLDGKDFVVDSVNVLTNDVLLIDKSDISLFSGKYVNTNVIQETVSQKNQKSLPTDNISNYRITDEEIGVGTKSERYAANVNAIRMLKELEKDNRTATKQEQEILAQYVGWGGLADVFDEKHSKYNELRSILNEYEYSVARASTLTAFYTPPVVIKSIYTALQNMGLKKANILEPSCGVGNFFGLIPKEIADSRLNGVEVDSISGRIAKQLYPKANISICGFEETAFQDNTFDVVVGNVPFGQFKVRDRDYDKNNFLIHDYFFAKALDKVKPGGVIAFITSKGTMDKSNSSVRKYIAKRAELLGAIRLPDNTFKSAAGTEVTSDILFLQKRSEQLDTEPEWVHLNENQDGIAMNAYFAENSHMILGNMQMVTTAHGMDSACKSNGKDLSELLAEAIKNIKGKISDYNLILPKTENLTETMPIPDGIKNMAFSVIDNRIYQRNDNKMVLVETNTKDCERFKGLISLNHTCQELIRVQTDGEPDEVIQEHQNRLNSVYDDFVKSFGRINNRANNKLFYEDPGYPLLSSLEKFDNNGEFKRKSDMFFIRTIRPITEITYAESSNDALITSLSNRGKVDMDYMIELTGFSSEKIERDLRNIIFRVPSMNLQDKPEWVTADEYLSGNVKEKLNFAKLYAGIRKEEWINYNIEALSNVQPKPLTAAQIKVRLGATWVPSDIIDEFMYFLLKTTRNNQRWILTNYSDLTGAWKIENKTWEAGSVASSSVYGTRRVHGYQLLEDCLNLKNTVVKDLVQEDGKDKYVINEKETKIAQSKQKLIRQEFDKWIWSDITRRKRLEDIYNNKFNSSVVRKYDGSYLAFEGANCNITFRPHQKDAVARILYGNNTLLDHCVGAGKSYVMIAAAMESKRLGLCHKSIIAVPNNIVGQMASDFMELYPNANILMATEKDFSKMNRKKFCSRIATGDYDAVIMGHSQFEKIPLSKESQIEMLNRQLDEVLAGISSAGKGNKNYLTVKALEKTKRSLEVRLKNLNDIEQDDTITFEQLGVDKLFVDEAHNFKNLFLYTKMGNVAGINTTESKKATDMYNKVRWLDEHTNNKGTVFATGTPVSNTMAELYTMQRYLQYDRLKQLGLLHFDSWASSFGETVTELELKPEGTGFRLKERFAKFFNVPELMNIFREIADIKTKEMLNLPVPKVHYENVVCQASHIQKDMVENLAERAEKVRDGRVAPDEDNMLLITSDGRKLALDQRIMDSELPDDPESKVNHCVEDVFSMWEKTSENRLTQLVFCDLSTPNSKEFNVYDDIKSKLINRGIPENEIAFVHDATTNLKKEKLFSKVRDGDIRVLIGSTQKCGTGTNVQDKLIATYDLDCPWRPADLEQRAGRIERQGNQNSDVYIYRYVTEGTFDAYMYQLVEKKQRFISQIMQGDTSIREIEDIDASSLNYAKLKALAVGNPLIQEKMELELQVRDLLQQKQNHNAEIFALQDQIAYHLPKEISNQKSYIEDIKSDIEISKRQEKNNSVIISGTTFTEPKDIGTAVNFLKDEKKQQTEKVSIGTYKGLDIKLFYDSWLHYFRFNIGKSIKDIRIGTDATNIGKKILSSLDDLNVSLASAEMQLDLLENELVNAKEAVLLPFPAQAELDKKQNRLDELDVAFEDNEKIKRPKREEIIQ